MALAGDSEVIPLHVSHNGYGGYEVSDVLDDDEHIPIAIGLPLQGRKERINLYRWIVLEEEYVASKFDDQRNGHDESMRHLNLEEFWIRQVVQYYDRANAFFYEAAECRKNGDEEGERQMTLRAQQAMVKAMMTAKSMVESSIRCFGNLPKPGVSSGYIEEWDG